MFKKKTNQISISKNEKINYNQRTYRALFNENSRANIDINRFFLLSFSY